MADDVTGNERWGPLPWESEAAEQKEDVGLCPRCGTLHSGNRHPLEAMKNSLRLWAEQKKGDPYGFGAGKTINIAGLIKDSFLTGEEAGGLQTTDVRP